MRTWGMVLGMSESKAAASTKAFQVQVSNEKVGLALRVGASDYTQMQSGHLFLLLGLPYSPLAWLFCLGPSVSKKCQRCPPYPAPSGFKLLFYQPPNQALLFDRWNWVPGMTPTGRDCSQLSAQLLTWISCPLHQSHSNTLTENLSPESRQGRSSKQSPEGGTCILSSCAVDKGELKKRNWHRTVL